MSELRILACAVALAAGTAAAVSAATLRLAAEPAHIASVRLAELVAAHAAEAARAGALAGETAVASRDWAHQLEAALARVAERRGAVLLPARAVAAGAADVTAEVEAVLREVMARPGSEEARR